MTDSSREAVLWQIASLYSDLVSPLNGPSGVPGDGDSYGGMPSTYTPTIREFERLLVVMREGDAHIRSLRWHLLEYHLKATRVMRHEPRNVITKGKGRSRLVDADGNVVTVPVIRITRHPKADEGKAREAVALMARWWGLRSEPMLPKAVIAA